MVRPPGMVAWGICASLFGVFLRLHLWLAGLSLLLSHSLTSLRLVRVFVLLLSTTSWLFVRHFASFRLVLLPLSLCVWLRFSRPIVLP